MAIAIFHESTVAASQYYFSGRPDMANFMKVIWKWWTSPNCRQQYRNNPLDNAISNHDDKMEFYLKLADWLKSWTCSNLYLSKQTSKTLVLTLRSQAMMINKDLLSEGYMFVLTQRLQNDPIERRFSQYRQMSGERFPGQPFRSHKYRKNSSMSFPIKADVDLWQDDLVTENEDIENLHEYP